MNGFEAYKLYVIYKLFFAGNWDVKKYGTKSSRLKQETFETRPDRWMFEKLAKQHKHDLSLFLIANFSTNPDLHVSDLLEDEAVERHKDWTRRRESLSYTVAKELASMTNEDFHAGRGQHPRALQKYLGRKISLESLLVLFDLTNIDKKWQENLKGDRVWSNVFDRINRYREIYSYDQAKVFDVVRNKLVDNNIKLDYIV